MTKYKYYGGEEFYFNDTPRTGWQWVRLSDFKIPIGKHRRIVIEEKVYRYPDDLGVRIWKANAQYLMSVKRDFNDELTVCEKIIYDAFPSPQISNTKYLNVVMSIQDIFYNEYTTIFKFLSSYPTEDAYSSAIVSKAKDTLRRYFSLLQDCTKELSKLLLVDEEVDLSYIEESIKQIQEYKKQSQ